MLSNSPSSKRVRGVPGDSDKQIRDPSILLDPVRLFLVPFLPLKLWIQHAEMTALGCSANFRGWELTRLHYIQKQPEKLCVNEAEISGRTVNIEGRSVPIFTPPCHHSGASITRKQPHRLLCVTTEHLAKPGAHAPASTPPASPHRFTHCLHLLCCFRDCSHFALISPHHHQSHLPPCKMQSALSLLCVRGGTHQTWLRAMLFHLENFMRQYA